MLRLSRRFSWTCSYALAFAALAFASPLQVIRGAVSDPSGAVIPNARVELLENGVSIASVATDAKGQYVRSQKVESGSRLRVSNAGFSTAEKPIEPQANASGLAMDFVLKLASFSEQVTVTSTETPTPQAQLEAAVAVLTSSNSDFLQYDANGGLSMLLPNRNLDGAYQKLDLTTSYQAKRNVAIEGNFQNLRCRSRFGWVSSSLWGGEFWPGK